MIFQLINLMIIIFQFGRIVYLHLKPYKYPELVRVSYKSIRISPSNSIHGDGFKI